MRLRHLGYQQNSLPYLQEIQNDETLGEDRITCHAKNEHVYILPGYPIEPGNLPINSGTRYPTTANCATRPCFSSAVLYLSNVSWSIPYVSRCRKEVEQ